MTHPKHVANAVEGHKLAGPEEIGSFVCDACSTVIEDDEAITVYCTTVDYTEDDPYKKFPYMCRVYCYECDRAEVKLPLQRAEEFIVAGDAVRNDDGAPVFRNTATIYHSPTGHGIPWDPPKVLAEFSGVNLSQSTKVDEYENFGPEDVIDLIMLTGVDVTEFIDDDGTISVKKKKRQQMKVVIQKGLVKHFLGGK